jgi:hypothetical protein
MLANSFYKDRITLITKLDKNTTKESYTPISFMKIDAN